MKFDENKLKSKLILSKFTLITCIFALSSLCDAEEVGFTSLQHSIF